MEKCTTDLEREQQVPLISLLILEKIVSTSRDVQVANLNKDDGLDLLINKLKKRYLKDRKAADYFAYEKCELFRCPAKMSIAEYLNGLERLYYDIQRYRATIVELNYENMKKQLKATHDGSSLNSSDRFDIKLELTYLAEEKDKYTFYGNNYNNAQGRYNSNKGRGNNNGGK